MDQVELLHAASHGDRPGRLVVAVSAAQPGDDPSRPGQARDRVRVLLPHGRAFKRRAEQVKRLDLRLAEHVGRGQPVLAVPFLHQLHIDARSLCRGGGELHQAVSGSQLAVFQLQPLRFHHPDDLPHTRGVGDLVRCQQPPVQWLHSLRWIDLPHVNQPQPYSWEQTSVELIAWPANCHFAIPQLHHRSALGVSGIMGPQFSAAPPLGGRGQH